LALDILFVTYFLTSITMLDPQTSDMRQILYMMSALSLASARLSKLRIKYKNYLFPYLIFFSGFQIWFYQMRWFYPHRSFKHSKWWRHKLGHT